MAATPLFGKLVALTAPWPGKTWSEKSEEEQVDTMAGKALHLSPSDLHVGGHFQGVWRIIGDGDERVLEWSDKPERKRPWCAVGRIYRLERGVASEDEWPVLIIAFRGPPPPTDEGCTRKRLSWQNPDQLETIRGLRESLQDDGAAWAVLVLGGTARGKNASANEWRYAFEEPAARPPGLSLLLLLLPHRRTRPRPRRTRRTQRTARAASRVWTPVRRRGGIGARGSSAGGGEAVRAARARAARLARVAAAARARAARGSAKPEGIASAGPAAVVVVAGNPRHPSLLPPLSHRAPVDARLGAACVSYTVGMLNHPVTYTRDSTHSQIGQ